MPYLNWTNTMTVMRNIFITGLAWSLSACAISGSAPGGHGTVPPADKQDHAAVVSANPGAPEELVPDHQALTPMANAAVSPPVSQADASHALPIRVNLAVLRVRIPANVPAGSAFFKSLDGHGSLNVLPEAEPAATPWAGALFRRADGDVSVEDALKAIAPEGTMADIAYSARIAVIPGDETPFSVGETKTFLTNVAVSISDGIVDTKKTYEPIRLGIDGKMAFDELANDELSLRLAFRTSSLEDADIVESLVTGKKTPMPAQYAVSYLSSKGIGMHPGDVYAAAVFSSLISATTETRSATIFLIQPEPRSARNN